MVGKDGKIYLRLVDVGTLLGQSNVYKFTKRFDTLVIQGKDVFPVHYRVMTQKSKLVTPDVVLNILNAELSSLATSFVTSLNAGVALVEGNLMVESYKLSPVLHVQDSPSPFSLDECLQSEDITRMDWPAYSPDLNPIEHVWICLADELQPVNPLPSVYRDFGWHCLMSGVIFPKIRLII
ncbi:uncharacterized protein TNCV_3522271 [Trichonephila clavipes]|uniref:Tc1-like transposase DDE domain-containing protein n=1 Tax=Trichonephila clavipes TaxID=2585209 RepID=A0A8X6W9Q7_TRICX|nr:uncharacterized protein TNCV_3522271 [Trichonephila clavipes]